jgi:hypothetical protein
MVKEHRKERGVIENALFRTKMLSSDARINGHKNGREKRSMGSTKVGLAILGGGRWADPYFTHYIKTFWNESANFRIKKLFPVFGF